MTMNKYRVLIVALIVANAVAWGVVAVLAAAPARADTTGVVSRVIDGDTVVVADAEGRKLTVRIIGIDTPETKHPSKGVECWGPEATQFARDTLNGQQVSVVADPTQDGTDRYGRILAYLVKPDGSNYSVEAARAGAARAYVYDDPPLASAEIAAAQRDAQAADRGLWGTPCWGRR